MNQQIKAVIKVRGGCVGINIEDGEGYAHRVTMTYHVEAGMEKPR